MTTTARGLASLSSVVAANVRAEAARRGRTQTDMARLLGMGVPTMSDRYRERTPWTLDEVERVADIFGISVADLVARPEGFEPPTSWLGADNTITAWGTGGARAWFCDLCGLNGPADVNGWSAYESASMHGDRAHGLPVVPREADSRARALVAERFGLVRS